MLILLQLCKFYYQWVRCRKEVINHMIKCNIISSYNLNIFKPHMNQFTYSSVSPFKQRPSENMRYLIQRQLSKLIHNAIEGSREFHSNPEQRGKHLQQLKFVVLLGEEQIQEHLSFIIMNLIEVKQVEIERVQLTVQQIMEIIGYHIKSSVYLPLMLSLLKEDKIKNSTNNTVTLLKLISYMLLTTEDLENHVDDILLMVKNYQQLLIQNDQGLITVEKITITLIERLNHLNYDKFIPVVFSVLLNVQATRTLSEQKRQESQKAMELLAKKVGYGTVAQLHSQQVGPIIENIINSKEYRNWTKTSKNRFKFDSIVRNCHTEVTKFLPHILQILEFCIAPDSDIEMRMDTLVLVEELLNTEGLRVALKEYSLKILKQILNVAIKWKVGKPQIKIRKAGMINMIKVIENKIITDKELIQSFDDLLPQIKACISDDWAPQLRLATCLFMQRFLQCTRDIIDSDHLRQIYVILLERLDDSQDGVRQKVTIAINMFFLCRYLPSMASISSILEYMINAIFVHYDDNNENIRDAVNESLKFAAKVDPNQVLKGGKMNIQKMKHKNQCEELMEFCEELIEERKL